MVELQLCFRKSTVSFNTTLLVPFCRFSPEPLSFDGSVGPYLGLAREPKGERGQLGMHSMQQTMLHMTAWKRINKNLFRLGLGRDHGSTSM